MTRLGIRTPTEKLVHKLRLMADSGGMLTRDRTRVVIEAADRLQEYYERLQEADNAGFNVFSNIVPSGGDTSE